MTYRFAFEAVDRTLRDLKEAPDDPFGGIPVVFGGDFAQTLPVFPGASRAGSVGASIQLSSLWEHFRILSLRQNMRVLADPDNEMFAA